MAQGILPYKYEEERSEGGMTALAGLPVYLELASVLGMGGMYPDSSEGKRARVERRAGGALLGAAQLGRGRLC